MVAVAVQYADNILKVFATSISIILSSLFSYLILNDLTGNIDVFISECSQISYFKMINIILFHKNETQKTIFALIRCGSIVYNGNSISRHIHRHVWTIRKTRWLSYHVAHQSAKPTPKTKI